MTGAVFSHCERYRYALARDGWIGEGLSWGIDLAPFWDEVYRADIAKQGGPKRSDGKILKPNGWQPPDLAGIFANRYPDSEAHDGPTR